MKISQSIAKHIALLNCFQAIHGMPRPVKDNKEGAVALVPFGLSGNARVVLNENVAALLKIITPHNDAVEVLRRQYKERLDASLAELDASEPDEEERALKAVKAERDLDKQLNLEVESMLGRGKEIDLEPLQRAQLNETANAFFPPSFASLLNEGLIGTPKKSDKAS